MMIYKRESKPALGLFQKPSEVLLYRDVKDGGLGLHHLQSKSQAHLIATFLQTASGRRFQQSLFHSWLYRYHVDGQTDLPNPGFTPYYNIKFFQLIKEVKEKSPLNPTLMSINEWYKLLLERNVVKREIDDEGRQELIPCKVEQKLPDVFWSESYRLSRLHGIPPTSKSFMFKLIHMLLPSKERLNHLTPATSPLCWCNSGAQETYQHLFFQCAKNEQAGLSLLRVLQSYDRNITEERSLKEEVQHFSNIGPKSSLVSSDLTPIHDFCVFEKLKYKKSNLSKIYACSGPGALLIKVPETQNQGTGEPKSWSWST